MPFSQAPVRARRILGGWRRSGWLWCCRRSCWWCSRRMTKRSSPAGSGRRRRGASERRAQSRSTPSEAKPGSLWTCGPAPSPAAIPTVCHRPPDCTRESPHSSAHPSTFGVDFQADFEDVRRHDVGLTWNYTKDHNRSRKLCFHHPQALKRLDLQFESAGHGPVVITWIGIEHQLYSGASPISLVEHCVTFRHNRRLLSLLGFVHNWSTSRGSATNGNGIMSFLGRQFYRPHPIYIYITERYNRNKIFWNILFLLIAFVFNLHDVITVPKFINICILLNMYIYSLKKTTISHIKIRSLFPSC